MDTKTIILIVTLLGGTNAATLLGGVVPARSNAAEAETLQSSCAQQLDSCINKLMNCAEKRSSEAEEGEVVANMSFDPNLEETWQKRRE